MGEKEQYLYCGYRDKDDHVDKRSEKEIKRERMLGIQHELEQRTLRKLSAEIHRLLETLEPIWNDMESKGEGPKVGKLHLMADFQPCKNRQHPCGLFEKIGRSEKWLRLAAASVSNWEAVERLMRQYCMLSFVVRPKIAKWYEEAPKARDVAPDGLVEGTAAAFFYMDETRKHLENFCLPDELPPAPKGAKSSAKPEEEIEFFQKKLIRFENALQMPGSIFGEPDEITTMKIVAEKMRIDLKVTPLAEGPLKDDLRRQLKSFEAKMKEWEQEAREAKEKDAKLKKKNDETNKTPAKDN